MDELRLRRLFHFNESDLAANRRGRFSENQMKRLDAEAKQEQKSARESAVILFVIAAAGMAIGITIGWIAPALLGRVAMFLIMGILWPFVWASKGVSIIRAANVLREPHLGFVRGRVHIIHHGEGEYTLQVEEMEFDVDGNPTGAFREEEEYTIYYVQATQEILSVDS